MLTKLKSMSLYQKAVTTLVILGLVLMVIFSIINSFADKKEKVDSSKVETNWKDENSVTSIPEGSEVIYYSEGDENGNYNYIVNGYDFIRDNKEMPYFYYQEIGSVLSSALEAKDIYSRELTFIRGYSYGTSYTAYFEISDSNMVISVKNDLGLDNYEIKFDTK